MRDAAADLAVDTAGGLARAGRRPRAAAVRPAGADAFAPPPLAADTFFFAGEFFAGARPADLRRGGAEAAASRADAFLAVFLLLAITPAV